ncbi:hypothetical protein AAFC00_003269 [Neodothiora populina]|uniref:Uncharacterized protein n=1 Tax=Neodothiora populina TaxID=2781224 RepID=A0ABR3PB19_9PEZI
MAKGSKLKAALDNYKGVDKRAEHQKQVQKAGVKNAEKRKRARAEGEGEDAVLEKAVNEAAEKTEKKAGDKKAAAPPAKKAKKNKAQRQAKRVQLAAAAAAVTAGSGSETKIDDLVDDEASEDKVEEDDDMDAVEEEWDTEDEEHDTHAANLARLAEDSSDSEDEEDEELPAQGGMEVDEDEDDSEDDEDDEDEEDIALSDLESVASEEKGDIIPHQRLTINNTAALLKAYKSIALPSSLSFSENQVVVSAEPVDIPDIDDDLSRELAFYKQSLDAAHRARGLLKKENVAFSRPADYFAEMVKSDEHMGKIKQKLIDEAAGKKASAEARRQRDLKKFGKQVQVAKLQERSKEKRDTMEKINLLKRKRQGADITNANEESMFDVALEDEATTNKKDRSDRKARSGSGAGAGTNHKRVKRDEKYGFGGKKRFAKSNDATSAADVSKFSVRKMKSGGSGGRGGGGAGGRGGRGGGRGGSSRPGKSRRQSSGR